jgi:hypothetical protein
VRNELIVQNVRPMIESTPLLEAPNGYARMMSGAARFRMVLVTGSKGDRYLGLPTQLHKTGRPSWWGWSSSFTFCLLAEAYARAGMPDRGLAVLAEIPQSIETVYSSEIYRCRGELLLSQGHADALEAENCFRTTVELARPDGHRSLELRAATSLSRLLQRQGKREEARHILAEIHSWFTEGFDTADLRNARTLLDELSAAPR